MSPLQPKEGHPIMVEPAPTDTVGAIKHLTDSSPTTFMGRARESIRYIRGRGALEIGIIFVVLQIGLVIYSLVNPDFAYLSPNNLQGVLTQSIPVLGIVGIGAGILMVAGEFDLSLGASIGFTALVFIKVTSTAGWGLGLLAALTMGIAIALLNGVLTVYTKIPSFIATLGMGYFWDGAALFYNGTSPAILTPDQAPSGIFNASLGYFNSQFIWMLIIGVALWTFLHRSKTGNHIFAVGGNAAAAKAISINPGRIKLLAFGLFGLLAGFAGTLLAVQTLTMQPGTTDDYTLQAIAAAVVGGTSLTGGRGSVLGMVIGAALIETIQDALILAQTPGFYIQLFLGLIIVVAAIFNRFMERTAS